MLVERGRGLEAAATVGIKQQGPGIYTPTLGFKVGRGAIVEPWLWTGQDHSICTFKSHSKELPLHSPPLP